MTLNKLCTLITGVVIAFGFCVTSSHASLIGSTATYDYRLPDISTVYDQEGLASQTKTVGNGIEFFTDFFSIDVAADKITYKLSNTLWNNTLKHNGPRITFAGINLSNASLDLAGTANGGSGLDFTWSKSYLDMNWANFTGNTIVVKVLSGGADVPEPASLAHCLVLAWSD